MYGQATQLRRSRCNVSISLVVVSTAAVAQILQEVDSANAFFENRTSSQPGNDVTLKDNFTKTIIKQINACKAFAKAEAIAVQDKLKHKNPYGPGLVRIQSAIEGSKH